MRLSDLLHDVGVVAVRGRSSVPEITGITHDSRRVAPGDLFCCIPGAAADGHDFAREAVAAGASALLVERPIDAGALEVEVASVRDVIGVLSSRVHGEPSRSLTVLGVTGTNGKTTTTYLLEAIARAAGRRPGVIGTIETRIDGVGRPGAFTTPEAPDLQALFAQMRAEGVDAVAMEVSSHALAMGRVEGTSFAAACFTNLSQDHLDFHGTLEEYFAAKAHLFRPELTAAAAVNVGDPYGARLAELCRERGVRLFEFDLDRVLECRLEASSTRITADVGDAGRVTITSPLTGRFNAANVLGAATTAVAAGFTIDAVIAGLEAPLVVPGRFEPVEAGQDFSVLVDYAHTPDALANVLGAAAGLTAGRLLVVFGCGGDRDRAKRPVMGATAAALADEVFVTSDNPRSEDPNAIIAEVLAGIPPERRDRVTVDADRRAAIAAAIAAARPGDVVVIAGKGHETGQTADGVTRPFDDRVVAREELEALRCG